MGTKFASADLTAGQLNAIVKKLGGHDNALRFLRDELSVSEPIRSWREENGVIYFSVESDGTTGEDWIKRLEGNGFEVTSEAKQALRSSDFKPTSGVVTEVAVLKGMLFEDKERTTKNIRAYAYERKLSSPNAEVACLILAKLTLEEVVALRLYWIVTMHEPIKDFCGNPCLLTLLRDCGGRSLLGFNEKLFGKFFDRSYGFAFVVA